MAVVQSQMERNQVGKGTKTGKKALKRKLSNSSGSENGNTCLQEEMVVVLSSSPIKAKVSAHGEKNSSKEKKGSMVAEEERKGKRTKEPGVRVIGNRIYDSENGKTCHQCRQKTRDFTASCKNLKQGGKFCTIKFCHKCLLNRYGENAEEMDRLDDWICPKCKGICNCSCCMKKRGYPPTGPLAHTAKANGFSSVSAMIDVNAANYLELEKIKNVVSSKTAATSDNELVLLSSEKHGKENSLDGNSSQNIGTPKKGMLDSKKESNNRKRKGLKEICNGNRVDDADQKRSLKRPKVCDQVPKLERIGNANEDLKICVEFSAKETKENRNDVIYIDLKENVSEMKASKDVTIENDAKEEMNGDNSEESSRTRVVNVDNTGVLFQTVIESEKTLHLPKGTMLTDVSGIEILPEDVGHALQFLEFCRVFGKVFDVRKGDAEAVLRNLIRQQTVHRRQNTFVIQFHIKLLTLILSESEDMSLSSDPNDGDNYWLKALWELISGKLKLDCVDEGIDGYFKLDLSKKLVVLNFLCDEALGTEKLRNYIDDENSSFAERAKEAKLKVAAVKEKEKGLKQKLQDEVAKAIISNNGVSLSISDHEAVVSKIRSDAKQAYAEMLELKGMVPKKKQRSDAIRIEPEFVDDDGHVFWKLKSYATENTVLFQDLKSVEAATADEKWFLYGAEQKQEIEDYISSRVRRSKLKCCLRSSK